MTSFVHVCMYVRMYGPVGRLYTCMIKYGIKRGWNVCPYVRYACALFVCPSVCPSVCVFLCGESISCWFWQQWSHCVSISPSLDMIVATGRPMCVCVWLPPGRNVLHGAIQCCIRHCHGKYLQDFESLWMFTKNSLDGVNSCVHSEHYIYVEY